MEDLLGRGQCIQVHLDGVADSLDLVLNMVVVHNQLDQDLVLQDHHGHQTEGHMVLNTAQDLAQTLGLAHKDQEQGRHTDLTK